MTSNLLMRLCFIVRAERNLHLVAAKCEFSVARRQKSVHVAVTRIGIRRRQRANHSSNCNVLIHSGAREGYLRQAKMKVKECGMATTSPDMIRPISLELKANCDAVLYVYSSVSTVILCV